MVPLELEQAFRSSIKGAYRYYRRVLIFRRGIKVLGQYYTPVLILSRYVMETQSQKMWYNKLFNRIQSFLYLHNLSIISIY